MDWSSEPLQLFIDKILQEDCRVMRKALIVQWPAEHYFKRS